MLKNSFYKGNVIGSGNDKFEKFITDSQDVIDDCDQSYLECKSGSGKYEVVQTKSKKFENLEVMVDKDYGVLQVLIDKDQRLVTKLARCLTEIPDIKDILDAFGNPKITGVKLERKRKTTRAKSAHGYDYNSAHVDGYHASLKIYVFLSDVSATSGPMNIYQTTSNWDKHPKLAFAFKFFRLRYFDSNFCSAFEKFKVPLLGRRGSYVAFIGNSLHSATNVKAGYRDTIQIYFDQFDNHWFSSIK